ncbi:hypothetical protein HanIR_Chr15g0733901 [Helianthus annuus]|nr:hypothetical protein HanIR_Chr15g0733901 [Helianthus annuus]
MCNRQALTPHRLIFLSRKINHRNLQGLTGKWPIFGQLVPRAAIDRLVINWPIRGKLLGEPPTSD